MKPYCKHCGQFVYARRVFKPLPTKNCTVCNTAIPYDPSRSRVAWERKQFCSRRCQAIGYKRKFTTLCSICGEPQNPHGARGLCAKHYMAWRRDVGRQRLDDYYIKHAFNLPANAPKALIETARRVLQLKRSLAK